MEDKNLLTENLEEEFLTVTDTIPGGIARFTIEDKFILISANQEFFNMMGYSKEAYRTLFAHTFGMSIEVADFEGMQELIKTQRENGQVIQVEYRHIMPDKTVKWISLQAKEVVTENNSKFFHGIFIDVTKFKNVQKVIDLERERYQTVSQLSGEILFEYDILTKSIMQTVSASKIFFHHGEFIPNYCQTILRKEVIYQEDIAVFKEMCAEFDTGKPSIYKEFRVKDQSAAFVWYRVQATTIFDAHGKAVKVIGKTENIDVQKRETEKLKEKSRRDPLTGFYNKIVVEEVVESYLLGDASQYSAFMIVDIDNFKIINDTAGHLFGDAVLIDVSKELKRVFSSNDIIGRIGGDEFVILLKNVRSLDKIRKKAMAVCETFRYLYSGEKKQHKISCSVGVSLYPQHGKTYKELFTNADLALYRAKSLKKDGFVIYEEVRRTACASIAKATEKGVPMAKGDRLQEKVRQSKLSLIRIFELLFDTKDVERGINRVIETLGKHYQIDRVYIIENTPVRTAIKIPYEWCNTNIASRRINNERCLYYGLAKEQLFRCEDIDQADIDPDVIAYFKKCGVKSVMQCGIYENGEFKGTIGFEQCQNPRQWTQEEIESLVIVAKFIGSYMVKMNTQSAVEKLAYTDVLTGMWNLNKFKLRAENLLEAVMENHDAKYAMICFDIDKFRYINNTFGFDIGDEILIYIANQLKLFSKENIIFTRMAADKFLLLMPYTTMDDLMKMLKSALERTQYFTSVQTGRYKLIFNCGIYLIDQGKQASIHAIIDKADIARSKVQSGHDSSCIFYNETFKQKLMLEKELEDLVDDAIKYKEFVVYYQPKIDLASGGVKGAEALVRWMSPAKGFMMPGQFIPLFEKNGFIAKLDFYVFEWVYSDLRRWIDAGRTVVPISVNLSRVHLSDDTFIGKLITMAEKYQIPTHLIEFELTESVFVENVSHVIRVMHKLKKLGFLISIDDFGSGYSSLRLLRDLPVDYLKLDKEFLDNGNANMREQIIIMNVIRMAKTLGIKVVSEGVETNMQAIFLKSCACDLAQGYLYARPMPVQDFEELMWA